MLRKDRTRQLVPWRRTHPLPWRGWVRAAQLRVGNRKYYPCLEYKEDRERIRHEQKEDNSLENERGWVDTHTRSFLERDCLLTECSPGKNCSAKKETG